MAAAEATDTYSAEQVQRLLTCAVCLDRFNNPKILPCQHTFCRTPCLEGLIDRHTRVLKCPECRQHHIVPREGADGFPTNISLSGFLDLPTQRGSTPSREAPQAEATGAAGLCGVCETEAETSRCFHCEKRVCAACKTAHVGQIKVEIGRLVNQIRRGVPKLSNTISAVEQKSEEMKTRVGTLKSEVTDTVERYAKELKDREKMLHSELETFLQGELRSLRLHQESLEVELASISTYCDSTESVMNQAEAVNNLPEAELATMKKQCADYLTQMQTSENNPIPEQREVNLRFDGQPVHTSVMGLGEVLITTPGTSNRSRQSPPETQQSRPQRARWNEPMDTSILESMRVSPALTYRTPRQGRRSHSPPLASQNRTQYSHRPTHSSIETDMDARMSRLYGVGNPNQTLPARHFPSRTNDYMFRMNPPGDEDLVDIMDRNREEEMNRRVRGRSRNPYASATMTQRPHQERIAGLMGGGGPPDIPGSVYNVIPEINPVHRQSHDDQTPEEISRAAAEAAERRARNTALTRPPPNTRPAAAFIIPLDGGTPQEIERLNASTEGAATVQQSTGPAANSGDVTESNEPMSTSPEPATSTEAAAPASSSETQQPAPSQVEEPSQPQVQNQPETPAEPPSQAPSQPQPQAETPAEPQNQAQPQNEARPNQAASPTRRQSPPQPQPSQSRPAERSTRTNSRRRSQNSTSRSQPSTRPRRTSRSNSQPSNATINATSTNTSNPRSRSPTNAPEPEPRRSSVPEEGLGARSRTFVQESGPSTSGNALPRVNGTSSTYDVPITDSVGDVSTEDNPGDSTSGAKPKIKYKSKGAVKTVIGGVRGTGEGQFTWPRGVAVNPVTNNVVVADSSNHRVQLFDLSGRFSSVFGSYGQADGEFDCLAGVAINIRNGDIVIADRYNHRIQVFDRSGRFLRQFGSEGSGEGELNYPWGVAVDRGGSIYICDKENHRVQVFSPEGRFIRQFGGLGSRAGQMENPHYIAVSSDGLVFVSDCNNHRVQVFSDTGRFIRSVGAGEGSARGQLRSPKGVAVDRQGFVVVADSGNDRIQVFRGDGRFYCSFGARGAEGGQFKGIEGIGLTAKGDIVVSDKENHRIQIF